MGVMTKTSVIHICSPPGSLHLMACGRSGESPDQIPASHYQNISRLIQFPHCASLTTGQLHRAIKILSRQCDPSVETEIRFHDDTLIEKVGSISHPRHKSLRDSVT